MKTKYSALAIFVIVLSLAITLPSDLVQTADALTKASGIKNSQYGSATKDKVCGDRLCTPDDFKDGKKHYTTSTERTTDLQSMLGKMDRLFALHRAQATEAWDTLSHSEKSHMMKMIDKMYEKMQSMDFRSHMKHMSSMMDNGHHDMKEGKHGMDGKHGMKEGKHTYKGHDGMSCGKGDHGDKEDHDGMSCGKGDHGDKGHN